MKRNLFANAFVILLSTTFYLNCSSAVADDFKQNLIYRLGNICIKCMCCSIHNDSITIIDLSKVEISKWDNDGRKAYQELVDVLPIDLKVLFTRKYQNYCSSTVEDTGWCNSISVELNLTETAQLPNKFIIHLNSEGISGL